MKLESLEEQQWHFMATRLSCYMKNMLDEDQQASHIFRFRRAKVGKPWLLGLVCSWQRQVLVSRRYNCWRLWSDPGHRNSERHMHSLMSSPWFLWNKWLFFVSFPSFWVASSSFTLPCMLEGTSRGLEEPPKVDENMGTPCSGCIPTQRAFRRNILSIETSLWALYALCNPLGLCL